MTEINKNKELQLNHEYLLKILDYDELSGIFKWKTKISKCIHVGDVAGNINKISNYIQIRINKQIFLAHRLAWFYVTGKWPENGVDHKDAIRSHNWISNLRDCTSQINNQNRQRCIQTQTFHSNIPGVHFRAERKKWRVLLTINNKVIYFGHYKRQEDAELVCIEARRKYYKGNLL